MQRDKHGREIKPGDLLKIPHFVAYDRCKVYMYKIVVQVDDDRNISHDGEHLYAMDTSDIAREYSLDSAFMCPLSVVGECEIIDDSATGDEECWWERKRVIESEE